MNFPLISNFKKLVIVICFFVIKYSTYSQTALQFNGTSSYVEVPYSASNNPAQFTIECWVRLDSGSGTFRAPLSSRNRVGNQNTGYNFYAQPDDTWNFSFGNNSDPWIYIPGPSVVYGQWTHLAATYDGTTGRFYVNGILVASEVGVFTPNSSRPLRIGAGSTEASSNYFFPGAIDEVRIWNYARSESEISNNNFTSLTIPQTGLASYYQFTNGTALSSTGINDGTLLGSPTVVSGVLTTAPTSISGSTSICYGSNSTLTTSGGNLGLNAVDVWYKGSCGGDAFHEGFNTQPYTTHATVVNSDVNGILNVTTSSSDPMLNMFNLGSFDPNVYKYINFRYKVVSGTAGAAQLYFLNGSMTLADGSKYKNESLISDNQWHTASVDMSSHALWAADGNITGIRYDYATNDGVTMDLDFIELSSAPIIGEGPSITVTPSQTTTYYVSRKGYNVNTTCISKVITVNALPIPSFTTQPTDTFINTDVSYITESGQSNYSWTIPGILNTDYSITSGGTSTSNNIVLKWLKTGNKSVSVNYTNSNNCTGTIATLSNSINIRNKGISKYGNSITNATLSIDQNGKIGSGKSVSRFGEIMNSPLPPQVGDTYQGGKIFYTYVDGNGETHGLIAATSDVSNSYWGCLNTSISGADGLIIGTGSQNTLDIVAGCTEVGIAAKLCNDLSSGGYSDWYLPSKDELYQLYLNQGLIGGFSTAEYWSSSEESGYNAYVVNFSNGIYTGKAKVDVAKPARAIRSF